MFYVLSAAVCYVGNKVLGLELKSLNSENVLVLDSLWKQPFGQYQLLFQGIVTLASR